MRRIHPYSVHRLLEAILEFLIPGHAQALTVRFPRFDRSEPRRFGGLPLTLQRGIVGEVIVVDRVVLILSITRAES